MTTPIQADPEQPERSRPEQSQSAATRSALSLSLTPLQRPDSRYRISDAVYLQLSESIRNLKLPPGTPISEPGIATQLQVSRSPVREAFTRLVQMGLISVIPQVGSFVAPISLAEVDESVFIRSALESRAFQRAIRAGTPDTAEIQRLVDENYAAARAQDFDAFFDTDEQLHENVFVLAGLPSLWDVVRSTKMQLDRLRRLSLPLSTLNPEVMNEHQQIVDALRARDEAGGVEVIEKHATRIFAIVGELKAEHPSYFAP